MANISIPKVLFAIIYFAVPIVFRTVPEAAAILPPELPMLAIIDAAMMLMGLAFLVANSNKFFKIMALLVLLGSLGLSGYQAYPGIVKDFEQVDKDYAAESGDFFNAETTIFQAKQGVILDDIVKALPDAAFYAWIGVGVLIVLFGIYSMKEIVAYAMIPANKSTNISSTEEIPDDVKSTNANRPTAEQRQAALNKIKAGGVTSVEETETAKTEQSVDDAIANFVKNTDENNPPVFNQTENIQRGSSSTIQNTPNPRYKEPPLTHDGRVNFNIDMGSDYVPNVSVEKDSSFESETKTQQKAPSPKAAKKDDVIDMDTIGSEPRQSANPFANANPFGNPYEQPAPKPAPAPAPKPQPQPQTAQNPFANANPFANPYEQPAPAPKPQPKPSPASEPQPQPQTAQNPFANANPFANPYEQPAPAPAPAPVKVNPAEPAPEPVNTAPAPAPEPVTPPPAVNFKLPEGPKEAPKPKLSQNRMSPENKARIRELNAQVAELKTLYNQGMITQEEYVAQRTELLQQMYSNS